MPLLNYRFVAMWCLLVFLSQRLNAQCSDPPFVNQPSNVMICSNQNLNVVFSGTPGATFNWTNSNPAIGVPAAGSGNINTNVITVLSTQTATFTVTPRTASDCVGTPVTFTVTVSPGTTPPLPNIGTICRGAPPINLPASPGGVTGTWSGMGVINNVFTPSATVGEAIQLLFVPNPGQCAIPGTITVTFFTQLIFWTTVTPGTYCQTAASISFGGIIQPSGTPGTWSGPGISPTGVFSPATAGPGTHEIIFTTNEACAQQASFDVQVQAATVPQFNQVGPVCAGETISPLPTTSTNGIAGTWSPAINNTATTTYTFTPNPGPCAVSTTMTIVVNPSVTPTFTQIDPICAGQNFSLPATSLNGITGSWSPAVNNMATTTYTFTPNPGQCAATATMTVTVNPATMPDFAQVAPICAGGSFSLPTTSNNGITGTWSPAVNNMATTTYTFTPSAGQCAGNATMTVTVNPNVMPTFTQVAPICSGGSFSLPATSNNGITGSWSPAVNNMATTTYTFTPSAGQCATNATMTVTVNPNVTPTFTQVPPICAGGSFSLPTTSNNGITGSWSPAVNNMATTTYTFTPSAGQCAGTATMNVTVNPNVTPTFLQVAPICSGGSFTLPTTSINGITGTWSPAINNMATTTYTFTPSAGQCANTATMTVTVNPAVTPIFTPAGEICSGGSFTLPATSNNGITGSWSPAVNNMATTTYTFTPSAGQCATTTTMTVTVNPIVTPVFTPPAPICSGESFTLPNTSNNGITGTWSPAVNNMATTTYTFTPSAGQCATSAMITVSVDAQPSLSIGTVACAPDMQTYTVTFTSANGVVSATAGIVAGNQVTGIPIGVNVSITVTNPANAACNASMSVNAPDCTCPPLAAPLVSPAIVGICAGDPIPTFSASVATGLIVNWHSAATGGVLLAGNSSTFTPASAGTYYAEAEDPLTNCTSSLRTPVTLAVATPQTPTFAQVAPICEGGAFALPSSSNEGIAGSWSPAVNNTATTTYTFTPIAGQCAGTATMTVTVHPNPVVQLVLAQGITCVSSTDGAIATTITGAMEPFSFDWNDDALDGLQNPSNLGQGTYSVVVTATGTGCTGAGSITLADPAALALVCAQQNPVSTYGGSDGSATVQISGGTEGYTIAWSGAASGSQNQATAGTAVITDLIAGAYSVTVTDANGCEETCTFSIASPDCTLEVTAAGTDPDCNGAATGSIALSITGATGTLTFDWNDDSLDGIQNPNALLAGTYSVTVADQAGCSDTVSVTLTDPAVLVLVCAQQNPVSTSGGSDGSATVQISGGTEGYTIAWSGAASGSQNQATAGTAVITDLIAGAYSVTVTDANGCEETCTFSIASPDCTLEVTAAGTDPDCNGAATGSIALSITGATGTLTFDWNDDSLDGIQNPDALLAGTYSVTVSDQDGCSDTVSVTLTDPAVLVLVCAQQNPVSSSGGSDGSATVQISGGTEAYTIAWSGAASGSQNQATAGTAVITDLIAGAYSVTVTDANGCEETCTFSIASPDCTLEVTAAGTDPDCNGAATGSIALTITGATGTLTFNWNDDSLDGIQNPDALLAGTYSVTVADQAGCSDTVSVTLTDPAALVLVCAQQNPVSTSGGSDGSATVQISGGTEGYTIVWSGAASGSQNQATAGTATITDLIAGAYSVTVTDANGCEETCTFSITSPDCTLEVTAAGTDPDCNGAATGSIVLTITGATGTLTFDWNDDSLDGIQNPDTLLAGTYSVTVTDQAGCSDTVSVTLTDPAALVLVCAQQNPVSTSGGSDGSATVQISGGTEAYTIAWSGAASGSQNQATAGTAVITDLIAGAYSVTVTDANGCEQTCTFSIASPDCTLEVTAAGTDPDCNGAATGSIALSITGATGTLTFDWNDDSLDGIQNPDTLLAGTYSVTVTDQDGCSDTVSVTLTDPAVLVLVCAQQNPVSSSGGSDGSATVQISGGTEGYTIAWSGAASGSQNQATAGTAVITDLIAGAYSVTVTDANGCEETCTFSIASPDCTLEVTAAGTDPDCNGAATGSIVLTITGATGTLTFDWNDDSLDGIQNPNALLAGTYSVTVTDQDGCSDTVSVTLTDPAVLVLVCAQQNPVSTSGGSDGSATVQISGGTEGYTIAWSGAASGSQNQATAGTAVITDLIAGAYSVTVTDANGCEETCTFSIASPDCTLEVTAAGTDPDCNGAATGSIVLTITGATGTLTFNWNDDSLDGIQNPNALLAGTYSVTVADQGGCSDTVSVTLTDPAVLVLVCAQQNPVSSSGGSDGSATVQISGGTEGYTIAWSGAASGSQNQATAGTAVITDLIAGAYSVTVTDANGCEETCTFSIASPDCTLEVTAAGTDPDCNGAATGSIVLTITGATGTLTFNWNDDSLDGIEDPTGLLAGAYSVTVTDGAGCTAEAALMITQPDELLLSCSEGSPSVIGTNGTANISINGGTAAYTLTWSGPVSGSQNADSPGTQLLSNLPAGDYTLQVTDANGCSANCTFTITGVPCALNLTNIVMDASCNGSSDGSINLFVTAFINPVVYNWSDMSVDGASRTNLAAGTYAVTVEDGIGCQLEAAFVINEPNAITLLCEQNNPASQGNSDGSATVQVSGGTAPYTIAWSGAATGSQNPAAAGTATITGLIAGNYNIVVTDANGCTQTCSFTITQPTCNLTLNATGTQPLCNGASNGSISLTVNGATGALTFDWSDNALDGIQNPTGLAAGTYSVTVTDAAGCQANTSVTLTAPAALVLVCAQQNPISTVGGSNGSATVQLSGGTAPYTIAWSGAATGSQNQAAAGTATITGLIAGNYNIVVTDANGCTQTCSFTITQPTCNLTLNATGTQPLCNGASNGSISLTVNGATGALTFDWSDNALDGIQNPTGLAAGTYSVTVTDAAGCQANTSVTLTAPAALVLVCAQQNPVSTVGGSNGSATVQLSGGTAPYTIAWSGAATGSQNQAAAGTATITGLIAGNYNIVVTDANGCTQTCSFTITQPACNLTLNATGTQPLCNGASNGSISLTVNGATGTLTFDWSDNALDGIQNPTGLAAGTYSVTVTDAAGCQANTSVTLTAPAALVLVCAQQNPVSTVGGSNGSATVQLSGGTAPYTIAWSGAATGSQNQAAAGTATITGLIAGNYNVVVTDANGCTQTCSFTITQPTCNLTLNATGTQPLCNGASNGSISLTVNGAIGALTFDWSDNALDGIQNPTGLAAGTYSVTVTDAAGCQANTSVTLTAPAALSFSASGAGATCVGPQSGSITITSIQGGTGPYEVWIGGAFTADVGTLPFTLPNYPTGNYDIAIRDANQCESRSSVSVPQPQVYSLDLGLNQTIRLGDSLLLTGMANFVISSVIWMPATGVLNPDSPESFVRPSSTTNYRLTALDANGCSATDSILVLVDNNSRIFVPNAFSPNDDNVNDRLTVFSDAGVVMVQSYQIFDRWGNQLFSGGPFPPNDPQFGWDGTFKGLPMDAGVYVFWLELEFFDGRREVISGEAALLR